MKEDEWGTDNFWKFDDLDWDPEKDIDIYQDDGDDGTEGPPEKSSGLQEMEEEIWNYEFPKYETRYDKNGAPVIWMLPAGMEDKPENWQIVKDYSSQYETLMGLPGLYEERGLTSFEDYASKYGLDWNEMDPYLNELDRLRNLLETGTGADIAGAEEYAARQMGISVEEYQNIIGVLSQTIGEGLEGQPGLTEEELEFRERYKRNMMRNQRQAMQDQVQNIYAETGSVARELWESQRFVQQIRDTQLQYDAATMEANQQRMRENYQTKLESWTQMLEKNQIGQEQFLNNVRANRGMAIQALSVQMNAAVQENQTYLQRYGQDLQALNSFVQTQFNVIEAEMGLDMGAMEMTSQLMQQALVPFQTLLAKYDVAFASFEQEYEEWWAEVQIEQAKADRWAGIAAGVISAVGDVIGAIFG